MTGNVAVRNLAAHLLAMVLDHQSEVSEEAEQIESRPAEESEEWDLLTAVAASLRESSARGDRRQPLAEIHVLRHLASRN